MVYHSNYRGEIVVPARQTSPASSPSANVAFFDPSGFFL